MFDIKLVLTELHWNKELGPSFTAKWSNGTRCATCSLKSEGYS